MTAQMRNLLIILGVIVVILLLVILLFVGKSPLMKFINYFFEAVDDDEPGRIDLGRRRSDEHTQKKTSEPIVVMATLVRKSDDRMWVIESTGEVRLVDEYYELEFVSRKGQKLKIQCSREAYDKVPFDQQGSLTYKKNTLVKFKYYEDIVYNN